MAPPELKNIHPLGKAPIVTVQAEGAKDPLVLAESGAIIEYLTEHFGAHLKPTQYQQGKEGQLQGETEEWMRYRYFMHYTEGTLMPFLVMALVFNSQHFASHFLLSMPLTFLSRYQDCVSVLYKAHLQRPNRSCGVPFSYPEFRKQF